jgi:hypothetical protein
MPRSLQSGSAGLPKKITLQSVDPEQLFFSDLVFLVLLVRALIDAQGYPSGFARLPKKIALQSVEPE